MAIIAAVMNMLIKKIVVPMRIDEAGQINRWAIKTPNEMIELIEKMIDRNGSPMKIRISVLSLEGIRLEKKRAFPYLNKHCIPPWHHRTRCFTSGP